MPFTIYMTAAAVADLNTAKAYYEEKSIGLGGKLAAEVDTVINIIALNPLTYSTRYKEVRAANISTFPYLIFYETNLEIQSVFILRVFNTYRKPFW